MIAIILAAGRGSRLRPYTDSQPKCFTELDGVTLLDRQIAALRSVGIDDIWIVTGYRNQMIKPPGTRQCHNPRWAETNMVESLFCMADNFGDDVVVSYSDIVYEPRILDALLASPQPVSVVVDKNWQSYWEKRFSDPLSDAETLKISPEGRILEIGDKASDITEIEAQYIGLMRFKGKGVDTLKSTYAALGTIKRPWMAKRPIAKAYLTDLLMEMILRGDSVWATTVFGGWLEFDTVEDLELVEAMLAAGSLGQLYNPTTVTVEQRGDV